MHMHLQAAVQGRVAHLALRGYGTSPAYRTSCRRLHMSAPAATVVVCVADCQLRAQLCRNRTRQDQSRIEFLNRGLRNIMTALKALLHPCSLHNIYLQPAKCGAGLVAQPAPFARVASTSQSRQTFRRTKGFVPFCMASTKGRHPLKDQELPSPFQHER